MLLGEVRRDEEVGGMSGVWGRVVDGGLLGSSKEIQIGVNDRDLKVMDSFAYFADMLLIYVLLHNSKRIFHFQPKLIAEYLTHVETVLSRIEKLLITNKDGNGWLVGDGVSIII